jgi:hypothetical protein
MSLILSGNFFMKNNIFVDLGRKYGVTNMIGPMVKIVIVMLKITQFLYGFNRLPSIHSYQIRGALVLLARFKKI